MCKEQVVNTLNLDEQAESICSWAAARAGVIVIVPVIGSVVLLANEVYMVIRIGKVYGNKFTSAMAKGFIMSFIGAITGQTLVNFFPFPPLQIPIGIGVTYGIGKAAQAWIKDGMPADVARYKEAYKKARASAKSDMDSFKNDPRRGQPLGDEKKKF